jgi:hypothetical protein
MNEIKFIHEDRTGRYYFSPGSKGKGARKFASMFNGTVIKMVFWGDVKGHIIML